jgi:hypothetical protein
MLYIDVILSFRWRDKLLFSEESVTFLSPNKKVTKEVGIGEALIASQSAPSPKNPSRSLKTKTKHRNQGENVPIFALPSSVLRNFYQVRAGSFLRGRLWRAGARHSGPLKSASFRTFLAETRKVHRPANNNLPCQ